MTAQAGESRQHALVMLAIILVGFNLRPAITSVGPLLGTIRDHLGLANWSAGILTGLPLVAFAVMSPLAPAIGGRLGNARSILAGLLLLTGGIAVRSLPWTPTLFVGTAIIGVGIAMMNVLLPAFIKDKLPHRVGRMTSIYSTAMAILAATAAGLAVPLARLGGLGWSFSLLAWGLMALVGIAVWVIIDRTERNDSAAAPAVQPPPPVSLWKSPLAWQVTFFMGLQSFVFYVLVSWLPEMMHDFGFSRAASGWMLSYIQFISLPGTFFAPILAEKFPHQLGIIALIGSGGIVGFTGLLFGGPLPLILFWITILGLASGSSISLSLAFLGMRTRNAMLAAKLSGMAQSVGYVLAATGPLLIGFLYDLTGTWTGPIITMIGVYALLTVAGLGAGRNLYVEDTPAH